MTQTVTKHAQAKREANSRCSKAVVAAFFMMLAAVHGQVSNVRVERTATQAVISYDAPDNAACSVEVREGDKTNLPREAQLGPLVPDVDASLFPGANLDSRAVNLAAGRRRIFVVGKRIAETALDGLRYSRALQTDTEHSYKIICGFSVSIGKFNTMNAPLGSSFNDPLPVDPFKPGQYAWPDFKWNDRTQWVVDPLTGFRTRQLDSPRDAIEQYGTKPFAIGYNLGGTTGWTNPNSIVADDTAAATYSGTTRALLFAAMSVGFGNSAVHNPGSLSANTLVPNFNAYCSSSDCGTAGFDDRSIQYCITVDGHTCASDYLEAALPVCAANCASATFAGITNPTPILTDWFASNGGVPTIDVTDLSRRTGTVTRSGSTVTLLGGDHFNLHWNAGSLIYINNVPYTIASVDHDAGITLSGSPAGTDTSAPYLALNAGFLIRKKTTSQHQISIQYISYTLELGQPGIAESGGDEDAYANCSPAEVAGPNGEMGYHCAIVETWYWIGKESGTVNRLARVEVESKNTADGWRGQACLGGSYWDWNDGNTVYCPINTYQGHFYILKYTYHGSNTDAGDMNYYDNPVICNSGITNVPCWTLTNLTPGNFAVDLQLAAFHPDWAATKFAANQIIMFGRMAATNSLGIMARRESNNDSTAFLFQYNLNTGRIVAGISTYGHFPLRWAGMHGPANLNDSNWLQVSATYLRGPSSGGREERAGNGPYYSRVTTAIPNTNQPCPARPANSPIPQSEWPSGNFCLTVTVDGEPGDPTPAAYSDGTISVVGTAVTGHDLSFRGDMNGKQIRIGTELYTLTLQSATEGTLDRSPGTLTNSPYIIYREPINNPKVGNPDFAYLQDADVRDVFCVTNQTDCRYNYQGNEFMRLLIKDPATPNVWVLQRGYAGTTPQQTLYAVPQGAWLIAFPSSCYFREDYPCAEARVVWDAPNDPFGYNANGVTVQPDPGDKGCCHSTRQNGVNVDIGDVCPLHDGSFGCYFSRFSGPPASFTDKGFGISYNPTFHGIVGIGAPNAVDSHPSHNQIPGSATPGELRWIGDSRPFLGERILDDGVLLSGTLYKWTQAQTFRLNPRVMPTMASCGANPLLDVSGTASTLTSGPVDNFKYCRALRNGECVPESSAGDLYVNCPQIRFPKCTYQGLAGSDPEARDICVTDMGAYTMNLTQIAVDKPDPDGINGRRVTNAYSRYKWMNQFWNLKILPNGRWMVAYSTYFQGQRNSILLVKLPPFPRHDGIFRNDYVPYKVTVPKPQIAGVTNAVVQFGYNKGYSCTSRNEACVQGAAVDFAYQSENPAGVACTNGCVINVQALSQRVLYFQVLLRDAANNVVGRIAADAVALQ